MRARIQVRNHVQDVGLRSIIAAVLIENGIRRGMVKNDRKDRTTVNVILDEKKEVLDTIVEELRAEFSNTDEYPQLARRITVSNWKKVNANPHTLPAMSPYASDALQLKQISKFVGVGREMVESINRGFAANDKGFNKLNERFDNLANRIDSGFSKLGERFDDLGKRVDRGFAGMNDRLEGIDKKLGELPDRLARAIKKAG